MHSLNSSRGPVRLLAFSACVITITFSGMAKGQEEPAADLEKAIATLRNIKPGELSEAEQRKKSKEMDEAWKVITLAGQKGLDRLKEEIAKVDREGIKDDFFKLDAAQLIWRMVGRRECDAIAAIWSTTDLTAQYDSVFFTAVDAAKTQDKKVLPMLRAVLRDNKGRAYIAPHAMDLAWPQPQEFVWGLYGAKAMPALLDVLKTSKDPIELRSAIILLGQSHCVDAIPLTRQFAKTGEGAVRNLAIECLGAYGHPDDYEFLVSGLNVKDEDLLVSHVTGLMLYEDLRATPFLIKLLDLESDKVRSTVIHALESLLTPDALDALHKRSSRTKTTEEQTEIGEFIESVMDSMKLDWDAYAAKTLQERVELLLARTEKREEPFHLKAGDRTLSHKGFVKVAKACKRQCRLRGNWVSDAQVLAATTPKDVELLLDVRAALYTRLSDECLYEVEELNEILRRMARRQYRDIVGLCAKVEPKRDKPEPADEGGNASGKTPSSKLSQQAD